MSSYLDVRGQTTYGIGICGRCSRKMQLAELRPDPNYPNLMVCSDDVDQYDPYRLAPRRPDQVVLPFARPDTSINANPSGLIGEDGSLFVVLENDQAYVKIV